MRFAIVAFVLFFSVAAVGKFRQNPKTVTIILTIEQADIVLSALGKLPYDQSAPVIQTIITQANQQLSPQVEKKPDTKVDSTTKKATPKKN